MMTARPRGHGMLTAMLTACTLLLYGCSNLGALSSSGNHEIRLTSEPAGATVTADGNEIGTTPLVFSPGDAFRSGFVSSDTALVGYRYIGKLAVKKSGCKDYLTEVNDNLLSKDIHVQLECDPNYQPVAQPATAAPSAVAAPPPQPRPAMPESAEQRLLQIDGLHDKGLLSDDEYRQLRQRVLDTL